jgi:hypothetical protein
MKILPKIKLSICNCLMIIACYSIGGLKCYAQDSTEVVQKTYVNGTFVGNLIIDDQSVMVPVKKTTEFAIQHRFGTINNGYSDMYGIFAPANIRLGGSYTPIDYLQLGLGVTKEKMQWDGNVKYAILRQAKKGSAEVMPVSVTFYGDMAVSTLPKAGNFVSDADRVSYFSQLIIARKITKHFSVQISPSFSYFNNIAGYVDASGNIQPQMKNGHFAIACGGRYKLKDGICVIANYDQPLTQHYTNNPHPNISMGIEMSTKGHTFQMFFGNYQSIIPQQNNVFNQNDYTKGQYLIGFNITRRWYHVADNN